MIRYFQTCLFLSLVAAIPAYAVDLEFVTVGHPGNPNDTHASHADGSRPQFTFHGGVDHVYEIGKYEVTNAQYVEFLNSVATDDPNSLYYERMTTYLSGGVIRNGLPGSYIYSAKPSYENRPVNYVSWLDAARFANWMHNGQPTGPQGPATTEKGAYDLTTQQYAVHDIQAKYWLPTEDEWYKAAYYSLDDGDGDPGYWLYATQSDTLPTEAIVMADGTVTNPGPGVANHNSDGFGATRISSVGATGSPSFFGTFDQTGNVFEWTEAIPIASGVARGGAFDVGGFYIESTYRSPWGLSTELSISGFRLARAVVPEPHSVILVTTAVVGILFLGMRAKKKDVFRRQLDYLADT